MGPRGGPGGGGGGNGGGARRGGAGGLGGVGGEARAAREPAGGGGDLGGRPPLLGDQLGRLVQPAAVPGPPALQVTRPVHLLGDVGQVEVGGEGAGQLRAGGDVHRGEPVGGGPGVLADQGADLLDQVQQRSAFLPG